MKLKAIFIAILLLPLACFGQGQATLIGQYSPTLYRFHGVPPQTPCGVNWFGLDEIAANIYYCDATFNWHIYAPIPSGGIVLLSPTSDQTILNGHQLINSGVYASTVATGTAPFSVLSNTVVPNLNVSMLLGSTWASPGDIGTSVPRNGAFTQVSATDLTKPARLILTPSGISQTTVAGAAVLGVPNTVTTPGAYLLPAAPATGVLFGTNSAGIEQFSHKSLQGTGTTVLSSSTVSGLAATLCTDASGAATTTGCGAGGGSISALTATKIPVASSATTLIDSGLTETGGILSSSDNLAFTPTAGASNAGFKLGGTLFTGGTGTTTFPFFLIDLGTAVTTWSGNGTGLGINLPAAFAGNQIDVRVNGASASSFLLGATGNLSLAAAATYGFTGRSRIGSSGDGILTDFNAAASGFTRHNFGGTTSSFPALCVSGTVLTVCAGDGTAVATLGNGTTTVGALPAAAAGNKGQQIAVSDSTTVSAEGQTCVGGSSNTALAFSNGVSWKCF